MSRLHRTSFHRFIAALAAIGGTFLSQQALAQLCVNQNAPAPLEICVKDTGDPGVWVSQPNGRTYQYYGEYSWGSRIQIGAEQFKTGYFAGTLATPVSNVLTGNGTVANPYVITTVLALGSSGVQMTQRFRYVNGDRYIAKIWTLENTGNTTHSDLRFFHGGDTFFGGDDDARSWYDAELRMVYVNNRIFTNSGYMAFYANPLTPISHYFSGSYSTGRQQTNAGALNDTSDSTFLDAGYYLQWNRTELHPGDVWRIEAFETWSPPGSLQVLTPADHYAVAGSTVRKTFKIQNLSDAYSVNITMAASTTSGWTLAMPGGNSATLGPLQVIEVPVDVQVPAGASAGSTASIVLDVTDGAQNTMWGATRVTVPVIDYSFSTRLLDFGTGVEGATSELILTFTNGASPVSIGQAGASDPLLAPFGIVADACSNFTLAAGATCTITVRFSPGMGADFSDSFGLPVASTVIVNETIAVTGSAVGLIDVSAQAGAGGNIAPSGRRIAPGGSASFTITLDTGYRLASITGCNGTLDGNLYTTAAVTTACTVAASFERQVFMVDVGPSTGGSVSPSAHPVTYGDTANFTATPSTGFRLASMSGCGGTLAGNVYTTAQVTGACTVQANFERIVFTVNVSQTNGGSISPSGHSVPYGDSTTFTATPSTGYRLASMNGCAGTLAGNVYTTAPVTGACTVEANFERQVLTVDVNQSNGGSISPAGHPVTYGDTATFTATASTGYRLASMTGCGGTLAGSAYTTAPVTGACTVQANFERILFTVNVSQTNGGSISPSGHSVAYGDSATFTATPSTGYRLASMNGCAGTLDGNVYTTAPVMGTCTMEANFERQVYSMGFTQSMGGNVSLSGQTATHGDRATFTITPDVGHHLALVQGCNGTLAGNIYTTAPVTAACTVEVRFERIVLPVSVTATAGGSISPVAQGVGYGHSATFTVTPDAGHRLVSVEGCEGTLVDNLYTTGPVTGACGVEVRFERLVYPLDVTQSYGGNISLSNAPLRHGDAAQFTITPAYGYLIGSVSGCPGTLNGQTFTTPPLTSACTLSATFVEELSTVTISGNAAGGGGSTGLLGLGGLLLLAMRRLRRAVVLVTAGAVVAGGAVAQQPGQRLHAGAMAGAATSSESAGAMTTALQARGYAVTANMDDQRMGWRIHGGWAINEHLALEVGYSDLGKVSTRYAGTVPVLAVDALLDAAVRLHPRAANGFDLSVAGRYSLPFANRLSVNARAGLFRWDAERRTGTSDGRVAVQYADGANLLLGAGLGFRVTRKIELTAEWMRHAIGNEDVQMAGMGIRYGW